MPQHCKAELVSKREIIPGTFHFALHAPDIARESKPGQFVMVQVQDGTDPLLRRPISLCNAAGDSIELLVQVRGRGTRMMAQWAPGRRVDILGPFGNGFTIPPDMKTALLIAGGIGAAPLLFLAKQILGVPGVIREFYFGTKTGNELPIVSDLLNNNDFKFHFASEAGFAEFQGFVTSIFTRELQFRKRELQGANVFSCGPEPMLKKVAEITADYNLNCQVSLEARMACGVGACLGCVIATRDGYRRVCADGPVFDSKDIVWIND